MELKRLDDLFWSAERQLLFDLLFPLLFGAGVDGAQSSLDDLIEIGIGVDWGLVNKAVRDWAKGYTFDLVRGITQTTREFLQSAEAEWIESGAPLDALIDQIAPMFGKTRAEMIAVTETTRCFAEGNLATWRQSGVVNKKVWMTAEDEIVCSICEPLGGMTVGLDENGFTTEQGGIGLTAPPAHVRCRCWLQPVVEVE
jgi:SPP1 gp7 family putative phage head morphogenesis protein